MVSAIRAPRPPTVNESDIALSLRKSRSSWTMFSVSNKDFIAAWELHSEMLRPTKNLSPRVCDPFAATLASCSPATSIAPPRYQQLLRKE